MVSKNRNLLGTLALTTAIGVGGYNAFQDYILNKNIEKNKTESLALIDNLKIKELQKKVETLEKKILPFNTLINGESHKFTVYIDLNSDLNLDKVTPLVTGYSIVELGEENGKYSQEYLRDYSYMEDIISDYILGTQKKLSTDIITNIYTKNPMVLCDVKKLGEALKIWPKTGNLAEKYNTAYKKINLNLGSIDCEPK